MPKRECLTCRHLHDGPGSRCPTCTTTRERARLRPTTTQRGYGAAWQRLSAQVIAWFGRCVDCGHQGSEDNPLTADHIVPKSRGGTDAWDNLIALCRNCNSTKGTSLPEPHPDPQNSHTGMG